MTTAEIQSELDRIASEQTKWESQFNNNRYAVMFTPGTYDVHINIGFYMQILGLGRNVDDVNIVGSIESNGDWENNNVTCNFWRGIENFKVTNDWTMWGVSQAAPARRIHTTGDLKLSDSGYASGGFLSDSIVDGVLDYGSQQQWLTRNSTLNSGVTRGSWNMTNVGVTGNIPNTSWTNGRSNSTNFLKIETTPIIREKPYLYIQMTDEANISRGYYVFVPELRSNSIGPSWTANRSTAGTSISIDEFYIANAKTDSSESINEGLRNKKHLLLTPGIYSLTDSIKITDSDTIVLGLGFPTLTNINGESTIVVSDVPGVTIAGLIFDASSAKSANQLQVGPKDSYLDHSANPTLLADTIFRVGGKTLNAKTETSLQVNSNNVIGDNLWIWRADHGVDNGTFGAENWNRSTADTGIEVNGDNVSIYGLMVEHYQKYQTIWNGNNGRVFFYQSEIPYDVPNQATWEENGKPDQYSWKNSVDWYGNPMEWAGYASFKISDNVTSHDARGLGIYCYFRTDPSIKLFNAVEVPENGLNGNMVNNMITFSLGGGKGEISNVINQWGGSVNGAGMRFNLVK